MNFFRVIQKVRSSSKIAIHSILSLSFLLQLIYVLFDDIIQEVFPELKSEVFFFILLYFNPASGPLMIVLKF